jgi:hypothetical protein
MLQSGLVCGIHSGLVFMPAPAYPASKPERAAIRRP